MRKDYNFHFLTGDVNWKDYGGKWYRYDGDSCYTVIELINMDDACGDTSSGKFLIIIGTIDLSTISYSTISSACHSFGEPVEEVIKNQLLLLEIIHGHGDHDTIASKYGNNYTKLMKWAKQF